MQRPFPVLKRLIDILGALSAAILLCPLLLVIVALIRTTYGKPVFFCQQRPGLHGKPFIMFKFRTMTDARDAQGDLLPDADRLTPLGRFLRRNSLDELPTFVNVLRGEMSLVGPRPLLTRYLPYYTTRENVRFEVRPGITGWAQINGRNTVSWDQRLGLDVWYVEHVSFWLDITILARTIWYVVSRKGVVVDPGSIMLNLDQERAAMRQEQVQ